MKNIIEINDVSMRFRMSDDRINSIKEFAIRKLKKDLTYTEFEALKHISFNK